MQQIRSKGKDSDSVYRNTASLLDEISDVECEIASSLRSSDSKSMPSHASTPHSSHASTPHSSLSSTPYQNMKRCHPNNEFTLPTFSPDVTRCIQKDTFYTSTQRNRLIKEACTALRGYCWENDKKVSNFEKRSLAKMLYALAPKSLGDSTSNPKPEVLLTSNLILVYNVVFV